MTIIRINEKEIILTFELMEKRYKEDLEQIAQLDNKISSLLNISILVLTIQLTFLGGSLVQLFNIKGKSVNFLLLSFLLFFSINIFFNIGSIVDFNNGLKSVIIKKPLKISDLQIYMAENSIDFKQLMSNYSIVIKENIKYIKNKEEYIEDGLNRLFISIILLILSFFIYVFLIV